MGSKPYIRCGPDGKPYIRCGPEGKPDLCCGLRGNPVFFTVDPLHAVIVIVYLFCVGTLGKSLSVDLQFWIMF